MQKLIRIINDDTKFLDTYLKDGWEIKQLSSCYCDKSFNNSLCYIVIEKK